METAVTIGLDLGKSVFQVHGVDAGGAVVVQRRLTRSKLLAFFAKQPACLVGNPFVLSYIEGLFCAVTGP
jgi:transposase